MSPFPDYSGRIYLERTGDRQLGAGQLSHDKGRGLGGSQYITLSLLSLMISIQKQLINRVFNQLVYQVVTDVLN